MTLQEAKDEVARKFDYGDWDGLVKTHQELQMEYEIQPDFINDVVELYTSSLRSELAEKEKEIEALRSWKEHSVKEIYRLKKFSEAADKVIEGYKNDNLKRDDFNFYQQLKNTKP